jgi:hypothetical protein
MWLKEEALFWIAVCTAISIRIIVSYDRQLPRLTSFLRASLSVIIGVFMAVTFTDAILDLRELDPDVWERPVAAVIAITGESIVRFSINFIPRNLKEVIELINAIGGLRK